MPAENLRTKTRNGLVWSFIERIATQGVQFLFGIILARILSPDDYGIIAMPLVFLAIAQCFIDSGFSTALVRKQELREEDLSTAFYFNVGIGIICFFILFFTSPIISAFYNMPILTDLLRITALATLFNPLCGVQQAILTKRIDFRTQASVSFIGAIVSGIIGLIMAYNGYGVWSLVSQQVGGYLIRTILLWYFVEWRPKLLWSWDSFHYLWGFGSKMLGSGLLDTIYNNIYPIVIGKYFSAGDLGNYTRAVQFANLPSSNVTGVLQRVTFPVLSTIQEEDEKLSRYYRRILKLSAFLVFPLMLGLSAISDPLIRILLTDKWEGCIILLQIMCVTMMWYPIHAINLNLLQVKGRSDLFFRLEVIKKAIAALVMLITIPNGIIWMVSGGIASSIICLVINTYYTGKLIHIGFITQIKDLFPIFVVSLVMWLSIHASFIPVNDIYIQLFIGIAVGFVTYLVGARFFLTREWNDAIDMMPAKFKRMKK